MRVGQSNARFMVQTGRVPVHQRLQRGETNATEPEPRIFGILPSGGNCRSISAGIADGSLPFCVVGHRMNSASVAQAPCGHSWAAVPTYTLQRAQMIRVNPARIPRLPGDLIASGSRFLRPSRWLLGLRLVSISTTKRQKQFPMRERKRITNRGERGPNGLSRRVHLIQ